jgi:tape measure domain-containing protein
MAKTTKLVGYGISFDMELVGGVKTADDFRKAAKSVQKSLNASENAVRQYELKQEQLNQALQKGAITKKQYDQAMTTLAFREQRRVERLEKERRAVLGLDRQESVLEKNRRNRARMAGMAAAGVSGLGMGGRAAGAARFLGGVAGLGGPAAALGLGFGALSIIKDSITAVAELETKVAGLKSLFGEPLGEKLALQFKNLAKTTILTNNQLIENAKTWASYGLTTEGLTDRLKRLGTVAGGNSEKFRALTIAFAQVNAQGKLMGQEKNQLINAGFSLQAVADAAGISMENFADAMKNGEIRAEHLNEALIAVTSEGGLFADYLEKQAETINGKLTVLESSWQELLQTIGESEKGPAGKFIDKLIIAAKFAKQAADAYGRSKGYLIPATPAPETGLQGFEQAGITGSAALRSAGGGAGVDVPARFFGPEKGFKPVDLGLPIFREIRDFLLRAPAGMQISDPKYQALLENMIEHEAMLARQALVDAAAAEAQKRRNEERARIEMEMYEEIRKNYSTTQQEFARVIANFDPEGPVFKKAMEEFASRTFTEGGEGFVGPMMGGRKDQEGRLERLAKEEQDRIDFEVAVAEAAEKSAKDKHKREMDLLALEEKAVAERLARDKRIAAGPADKDAMFTGGSVEEFMFLRRQTQQNEAAIATKAAEDRAQEQRDRIAEARKTLDERLATALEQIATQLSINTNDSM